MAMKFQRKRKVNAMRIGIKVGMTVLALYVGGFFLNQIGSVMTSTCSPFYRGLTLIGWTMNNSVAGETCTGCCIQSSSGSGILAIVGIIAIASLIFEFVDIRMT